MAQGSEGDPAARNEELSIQGNVSGAEVADGKGVLDAQGGRLSIPAAVGGKLCPPALAGPENPAGAFRVTEDLVPLLLRTSEG